MASLDARDFAEIVVFKHPVDPETEDQDDCEGKNELASHSARTFDPARLTNNQIEQSHDEHDEEQQKRFVRKIPEELVHIAGERLRVVTELIKPLLKPSCELHDGPHLVAPSS